MTTNEAISAVFSMLHDGSISAWSGDKSRLTLTVECLYLAERIDKSFDRFYLELRHVDELSLSTWPDPLELPVRILTEPEAIFKAELEILSAEMNDGKVIIACNQHDKAFDYRGGNLIIRCQAIKVYDQGSNELTIAQLRHIGEAYWDEWGKS